MIGLPVLQYNQHGTRVEHVEYDDPRTGQALGYIKKEQRKGKES